MKRLIIPTLIILSLFLCSCNVEVGTDTTQQQVSLPDGCFSYLTYSTSKVSSTKTDTYSWLSVGIEDPNNIGWDMYAYEVYVSLNGESWSITSGTSFEVPNGTATFYLKAVARSICYRDGNTFDCTSISVYKNATKQSGTCYVQIN